MIYCQLITIDYVDYIDYDLILTTLFIQKSSGASVLFILIIFFANRTQQTLLTLLLYSPLGILSSAVREFSKNTKRMAFQRKTTLMSSRYRRDFLLPDP